MSGYTFNFSKPNEMPDIDETIAKYHRDIIETAGVPPGWVAATGWPLSVAEKLAAMRQAVDYMRSVIK